MQPGATRARGEVVAHFDKLSLFLFEGLLPFVLFLGLGLPQFSGSDFTLAPVGVEDHLTFSFMWESMA